MRGEWEKVVFRVWWVNSEVCCSFSDSGGLQVLEAWQFSIDNSLCSPNWPSLLLTCLVAESNQKIRNVQRTEWLPCKTESAAPEANWAVWGDTWGTSAAGLFLIMESLLDVHFRCWEMGVSRNLKPETILSMVMAASEEGEGLPLKSTVISMGLSRFSSRLFWPHQLFNLIRLTVSPKSNSYEMSKWNFEGSWMKLCT